MGRPRLQLSSGCRLDQCNSRADPPGGFEAVNEDPENAVEIVRAAMEVVQQTGRFPSSGAADGKRVVDPGDGIVTLPEIADQIAQVAIQANPALAAQITQVAIYAN